MCIQTYCDIFNDAPQKRNENGVGQGYNLMANIARPRDLVALRTQTMFRKMLLLLSPALTAPCAARFAPRFFAPSWPPISQSSGRKLYSSMPALHPSFGPSRPSRRCGRLPERPKPKTGRQGGPLNTDEDKKFGR